MKKIFSSSEMKMIDDYSIKTLKIPSFALMERAAAFVADEIAKNHDKNDRILAVCGVGNNGADGLAVLRILNSIGFHNTVAIQVGSDDKATEEYMLQKHILSNIDIPVYMYETINNSQMDKQHMDFKSYDVIVDAIFGIGLTRVVSGVYKDVIEKINITNASIYAVDIPSGIDGNTGNVLGVAVKASKTITFGANKIGNVLYEGTEYAGDVIVCNIGFSQVAYENRTYYKVIEQEDIKKMLPQRKAYSNKGTYGKLLIIAGSETMYGAAYLCSAAAFAIGVGLVKVITSENNKQMLNDKLPEAIVISYGDNEDDRIGIVKNELEWCDTILIGPGLGLSNRSCKLVDMCISTGKNIIIDADGLNTIARYPELKEKLHNKTVITPHLGEAARLCGMNITDISKDILMVCEQMAETMRVSCVLKDARTVIYTSNGDKYINMSGNSGMAKAGSGDVLAGIIAGLVATGMDINDAAAFGPYIHGRAGDIARQKYGEYTMMPTNIIESVSQIIS